jgi:hypothetical protein
MVVHAELTPAAPPEFKVVETVPDPAVITEAA